MALTGRLQQTPLVTQKSTFKQKQGFNMAMKTTNLGSIATADTYDKINLLTSTPTVAIQYVLTGDPTAAIIDYEGSLDGNTWGVIETHTFSAGELTDLSAFRYVTDKPVPYFRLNVSTLTFTTAGTIVPIVRYEEL